MALKMKQVIKKKSSLVDLIEQFFSWLQSHNIQSDFTLLQLIVIITTDISKDEEKYCNALQTCYNVDIFFMFA